MTWADVLDAGNSHPDDPLAWARGTLGDTASTRRRLSAYGAARKALGCE